MPSGSSRDWLGCIIDSFFCNVPSNKVNYQMYSKQQKSLCRKYIKNSQEVIITKIIKKRKRWRKLAGRNVIKVCCNTLKESEKWLTTPEHHKKSFIHDYNVLHFPTSTVMTNFLPLLNEFHTGLFFKAILTIISIHLPLFWPLKWGSERSMNRVIFSMGVQLTWVVAYESVPVLW